MTSDINTDDEGARKRYCMCYQCQRCRNFAFISPIWFSLCNYIRNIYSALLFYLSLLTPEIECCFRPQSESSDEEESATLTPLATKKDHGKTKSKNFSNAYIYGSPLPTYGWPWKVSNKFIGLSGKPIFPIICLRPYIYVCLR